MSIAVLVPCYKRPEYTRLCLESIASAQDYDNVHFYIVDDGSNDGTWEIIQDVNLPAFKIKNEETKGLRNVIIDFFETVKDKDYAYITKVDNDCTVPKNWLNDLKRIIEDAKADIISPNVSETNAAHKYGIVELRRGDFIPSKIVGGLWFMRREMITGLYFEQFNSRGIKAAFHLLNLILVENSPKVGWTDAVTYQDIGHSSGTHKDHIKSIEHAKYSVEVGRRIAWQPQEDAPIADV